MTYDEIQKVNEGLSKTDIKGKEYISVNERIKAFRQLCPEGSIITQLVTDDDGKCIMKATVANENDRVIGTGYAYEQEGSTFINKTSYIENCETSAVGRALGMCGIGIDTSVASAEEVKNAQVQQTELEKIDKVHQKTVISRAEKAGVGLDQILERYKIHDISNMNYRQFNSCMKALGAE